MKNSINLFVFCQLLYSSAKSLFFSNIQCCVSVYVTLPIFFMLSSIPTNCSWWSLYAMEQREFRSIHEKKNSVLISSGFNVCKMSEKRLMCIKWKIKCPLLKNFIPRIHSKSMVREFSEPNRESFFFVQFAFMHPSYTSFNPSCTFPENQ